jgi:hypothetical protein
MSSERFSEEMMEKMLEDMDKLDKEASETAGLHMPPMWDHINFEVAVNFNSSAELQERFQPHVDACNFCQEMLKTFNPK